MNAMQLQDAIGEIRDCYILAAHSEQNKAHTNSKVDCCFHCGSDHGSNLCCVCADFVQQPFRG